MTTNSDDDEVTQQLKEAVESVKLNAKLSVSTGKAKVARTDPKLFSDKIEKEFFSDKIEKEFRENPFKFKEANLQSLYHNLEYGSDRIDLEEVYGRAEITKAPEIWIVYYVGMRFRFRKRSHEDLISRELHNCANEHGNRFFLSNLETGDPSFGYAKRNLILRMKCRECGFNHIARIDFDEDLFQHGFIKVEMSASAATGIPRSIKLLIKPNVPGNIGMFLNNFEEIPSYTKKKVTINPNKLFSMLGEIE